MEVKLTQRDSLHKSKLKLEAIEMNLAVHTGTPVLDLGNTTYAEIDELQISHLSTITLHPFSAALNSKKIYIFLVKGKIYF